MSISRRQLWSACLGNFFEHYDTALFGFLSPFLAPLIFPQQEPLVALILTYAMIPLGMIARPIGALVFGVIGDRRGREQALFFSLGGMALISLGIAFSPTYAQAGLASPLLFCLGRVMQNFLAAGETMGGAIFLLEHTPEKRHDMLSGFYSATTIGGILLASGGVAMLGYFQVIETGWRILYLIGCGTALFAFIIRGQPVVKTSRTFSLNLFKSQWKPLIWIAVCSGFAYANYSLALVLINGFVPLISSITKEQMMSINTLLLIFDFCTLPLFGWLASKTSREKVMFAASLTVVITGIPLFLLLPHVSLIGVIGIRICLVLFGVAFFAPFHAWAQQLVHPQYRYGVISFGYAIGSQLLGGPTAALSLWLFKQTGMAVSVCWYWVALAALSCLSVALSWQRKRVEEMA